MHTKEQSMKIKIFHRLLAAAWPALLAGCMSAVEDDPAPRIAKGTSLSMIRGAKTAVMLGDRLYVANRDSAAVGIAVVDPAADTVTAFYNGILPPNQLAPSGDSLLIILETDYKIGALSLLDLRKGELEASYKQVHSDNALSFSGDKAFLMERKLGVVTGFTQGKLAGANVFLNVNTGANSNPYQAALYGNTAFITRYGRASLLILEADKMDGGRRDSIDLSAFVADSLKGDSAAVPGMDAAVVYGKRVFVTVQRLTGYKAKDTSKVVVIDAESRKVVGAISLLRRNPIATAVHGKYLYVSSVESYGTFTGAVERIDMEKEEHAGIVVEEKDLSPPSDLVDFVPVSDSKGYVIFSPVYGTGFIRPLTLP
jgi:hypothetical protein